MSKIVDYIKDGLKIAFVGGLICLIGHGCNHCANQIDEEHNRELRKSQERIKGVISKHDYQRALVPVPEKRIDGLVSQAYSNKTVTIESNYNVIVKTRPLPEKTLSVNIVDGGSIKKDSIYSYVKNCKEEGGTPKISFQRGNLYRFTFTNDDRNRTHYDETYFNDSTIMGTKRANRVKVSCE